MIICVTQNMAHAIFHHYLPKYAKKSLYKVDCYFKANNSNLGCKLYNMSFISPLEVN